MDQKLQAHIEPLNQPNLIQVLYALGVQQLVGLGHLEQRYEHDTKAIPFLLKQE